jgi:F0F1-type ATP synthase assembly protein I
MPGAQDQASWADLGKAWNAVIEFVCAVGVYGIAGWYADKWLGTGHWLFLTGLVLGMVLGIYIMMKRAEHQDHDRTQARAGRASG